MENLIDFTNAEPGFRDYGGSDAKISILYQGQHYMLKFPEEQTKTMDIQTSEANNVFSEYIGSHIVATLNLPVHETLLGVYKDEPVVACKDFVPDGYRLQEFEWFSRNMFRKNELGRIPTYEQLYKTFDNPLLKHVKEQGIQRYWDTFIADALIGNFDRHRGNWGYLVNEKTKDIRLAPIYDCGSSLYPGLSEIGFEKILNDQKEIEKRIYDFPKAALNKTNDIKHVEKFGYYELLSSNIDNNCVVALKRITSSIDLQKINFIIDNTPIITNTRKRFYKDMIKYRKELILDRSILIHKEQSLDELLIGLKSIHFPKEKKCKTNEIEH